MKKVRTLFLIASLPAIVLAQPTEEWVRRYNGTGKRDDGAYSIAVDGAGNVYVTGQSYDSGTNWDYATIKYNSSGVQQWVARYNGPGNGSDGAHSIAVDGAGNVYVTGCSEGSGTGYDYATIKYNSSGIQQWVARYNGPGNKSNYAYSIAVDGADNVYVTGWSEGSGTSFDYATIKYSQAKDVGITDAVEPIDSVFVDTKYFPTVTVANFTQSTTEAFPCTLVIGGEEAGVIYVADTMVDGLARGEERDITFDEWLVPSGVGERYTLYATSYLACDDKPDNDTWEWTVKSVARGAVDVGVSKINTPPSVTAGETVKPNATVQNYGESSASFNVICQIKPSGSRQVYEDTAEVAGLTLDDTAKVVFKDWTPDAGSYVMWVKTFLIGDMNAANDSLEKTINATGIAEVMTPTEFALSCIRPNPMSSQTVISYQLPVSSEVSLVIYDVSGKLMKTLVTGTKETGSYTVRWDGRDDMNKVIPAGIYFIRFETQGYKVTRKLILLKK